MSKDASEIACDLILYREILRNLGPDHQIAVDFRMMSQKNTKLISYIKALDRVYKALGVKPEVAAEVEPDDEIPLPPTLNASSVGEFYLTRGGWPARVVHQEYGSRFYCIHMLGHDGSIRTLPIEHRHDGHVAYKYPDGTEPPIPQGHHPADLVSWSDLSETFGSGRYQIRNMDGTPWEWKPK